MKDMIWACYDGSKAYNTLELTISVAEEFGGRLNQDWIGRVFQATLEAADMPSAVEASLVITDAETLRRLNKEYRGKDEGTDVLAFALRDQLSGEMEPPFVNPPDGILHLGEVIVSYPQAVKQAAEQGHSVEEELKVLIVHGVLHLLGYDHEEPELEKQMRAKERKIIERINSSLERK